MEDYFVVVFKDSEPTEEVTVEEILRFYSAESLFDWMQDNRSKVFAVYKGKCVLDYS